MADKTKPPISQMPRPAFRHNQPYSVGCLIVLGTTGAFFVIPVMFSMGAENIVAAFNSIDWTSFSAFRRSLWQWLRYGTSVIQAGFWVFGLCYCVLVWQWLAELCGWRRFLSGKYLWAVSSLYFFVVEALVIYLAINFGSMSTLQKVAISIPVVFLMLTLSLCWTKTKDES